MTNLTTEQCRQIAQSAIAHGLLRRPPTITIISSREHRAKVLAMSPKKECPVCGRSVPMVDGKIIRHRVTTGAPGGGRICTFKETDQ